jgi:hypothetical protein
MLAAEVAVMAQAAAVFHAGVAGTMATKVAGGKSCRRGESQSQHSHSQKLQAFHRRILL